jgi:tetratricopeptide (TPR) repeat protein
LKDTFTRTSLALALAALLAPGAASAQEAVLKDRPGLSKPLKPATKQELDHREALKLYGLGVIHERANRLLEALRAFEQALKLDPEAAPLYRALYPLYIALDRGDDALAVCKKAVELDPGDVDTWYQYARHLRALERNQESAAALERALECPDLKERTDLRAQIYLDLGILRENAKEYKKAEAAFRQVAAVLDNPDVLLEQGRGNRQEIIAQAAEIYERLGNVCLRAGRLDQAVRDFQTAQKKDPGRTPRMAYNLAEVYRAQKKPKEALQSLDAYLATQPQGIEAYERKIELLKELGRDNDILPSLRQHVKVNPFKIDLKLLLAREYGRQGQARQAEEVYLELLGPEAKTGVDSFPDIYRGLFSLYRTEGKSGAAKVLRTLDAALKATGGKDGQGANAGKAAEARAMLIAIRDDPKLVEAMLPVVRDRLAGNDPLGYETRYYFAVFAARARMLDEAEKLFQSCLDKPSGTGRRNEAEVYDNLLRVLELAHKYDAIVALCRRGLEKAEATNRVLFHIEMAKAFMALGKSEEALAAADKAVDVSRDEYRLTCRRMRAGFLAEAGHIDKAEAECLDLLKEYKKPGDVRDIRYSLSGVYSTVKKLEKAEEQLQLILKEDANDATANNDLGYIWADQGKNLPEAEKLIRKAIELDRKQRGSGLSVSADSDQDNGGFVDSLGWVLFRRGQLKEARAEMERAVKLPGGSDDPTVWDHLGDVCFKMNDAARARTAWKKALELFGGGHRRKDDERREEIKRKLKLPDPPTR